MGSPRLLSTALAGRPAAGPAFCFHPTREKDWGGGGGNLKGEPGLTPVMAAVPGRALVLVKR